jgi:hypothetical protein
MTTTDNPSMEQCAREHADRLSEEVRRLIAFEDADKGEWKAVQELREDLEQRNYGAGISYVIDVTLYGGGPAGGIQFECSKGSYGLEMDSARAWHQDWFQPKGWTDLDSDVATRLWDLWGLEYLGDAE